MTTLQPAPRHEGRRILLTGAANGIGRAAALRLIRAGARVAAVDVAGAALDTLVSEAGRGAPLLAIPADVTKEEAIASAFAQARERWQALDVVMANAAIEPVASDNYLDALDAQLLRRVIEVNVVGLTLTCKHGVRALLAAGRGTVVITASPTGLYGVAPEEAAYSISKSGAVGLMRVIASGYAKKGIRANAVVPGFTATRANQAVIDNPTLLASALHTIPLGRPASPDEIAAVMSYLASDEASYVTGAVWAADGGLTAI